MRTAARLIGLATVVFLAMPFWSLSVPACRKLNARGYQALISRQIAATVAPAGIDRQETVRRLADYAHAHLWTTDTAVPYEGRVVDFLVRGIGWCDYQAKVFISLLAVRGIPARSLSLRDSSGDSPHTIAEVWDGHRWALVDVNYGIPFKDAAGRSISWEELIARPALLDEQPLLRGLAEHLPERAEWIRGSYRRVFEHPGPPLRSKTGTSRLNAYDRLLLAYAGIFENRFVWWYQDTYLARVEGLRPGSAEDKLMLARHWELAGRSQAARRAYGNLVGSGPVSLQAQFWLALSELEDGHRVQEAAKYFEQVIEQDTSGQWKPVASYYRGVCEAAAGRVSEAHAWYGRANQPGIPAAWSAFVAGGS